MTDEDLTAWWPDLGHLAVALRHLGHPDVADGLRDAVTGGATSSETLGSIGMVLLRSAHLRSELTRQNREAWDRVMADVNHAYPPNFRFNHWLAQLDCRMEWLRSIPEWLVALVLILMFLVTLLIARAFS